MDCSGKGTVSVSGHSGAQWLNGSMAESDCRRWPFLNMRSSAILRSRSTSSSTVEVFDRHRPSCQASLDERTRKDARTERILVRIEMYFLFNWPSKHKQWPMNNKYNITLQTNVIIIKTFHTIIDIIFVYSFILQRYMLTTTMLKFILIC